MKIFLPLSRMILLVLLGLPAAHAQITAGDLQIMARALSFLEKPLTGDVTVGIVYSPANSQSQREAEEVQRILGDGLRVGNLTLKPLAVPLANVARSNAGLLLLTSGLGELARPVAAVSQSRHVPCVTTDLAQVKNGTCVVGVRSQPKIQILVNSAAAAAGGTSFSTVFRLMITEI